MGVVNQPLKSDGPESEISRWKHTRQPTMDLPGTAPRATIFLRTPTGSHRCVCGYYMLTSKSKDAKIPLISDTYHYEACFSEVYHGYVYVIISRARKEGVPYGS